MISTVVNPVKELGKKHQNIVLQHRIDAVPFLFDQKSKNEPTEFRLFFRISQKEYCDYLAVKYQEIISESLYRKAVTGKKSAMIFQRDSDSIELGYSINKKSINTSVNPKMPYLSFLAINYDIETINGTALKSSNFWITMRSEIFNVYNLRQIIYIGSFTLR